MSARRIAAAALGVAVGLITWPLVAIAWPVVVAWYLYNEQEAA